MCNNCGKQFNQKSHHDKHMNRITKCENKEKLIEDLINKKVSEKVNSIIDAIKHVYVTYNNGEYDKVIRSIKTLKEKLKKMRQSGLDREGEYSFENIAFKVLRRSGYLDKLTTIETRAYDNSLTLDESIKLIKY